NPLTQLNHLCAALFRAGVPLDLAPLFAHRTLHDLDMADPRPAPKPSRTSVPLRMDWSPLKEKSEIRNPKSERNPNDKTENPKPADRTISDIGGSDLVPPSDFGFPADADRMPVLGRVTHFVPAQELKIERTLDLNEDLYLADHLFVYA